MTRQDLQDDGLREVFQRLPRTRAEAEVCPSPETLWAAASEELDPEARQEVVDHLGRCPSCAEDWRLGRFLVARESASEGGASRSPSSPRMSRWLAVAAALVLVLVASWWLSPQRSEREPVFRTEPVVVIESLVPENRPLSRADPVLRWRGPEGARYRLVVTTERMRVLVQEEDLADVEYRLDEALLTELAAGDTLLWQLEATLPDGERLASQTFRLRLE